MSVRTSLRHRFRQAEWNTQDKLFNVDQYGHVQRYAFRPAPKKRPRRKLRRQAVMDGGHILLLAFIIGGALWVLLKPSVRALVQ
ncbi:hypothetical protein JHN48_34465, partial [Streptomyces sp. MBT72]|uniref:hypothetical protein n=1 Tax=Streptomyces sp. MBT72 TaxID=1488402 RepID=UPI001916313D